MSFLIGGLSPQQYKSYLNPAPNEERQRNLSHWVAHFHLSRYPTIAILVNRMAYFILHRFSIYPNNAYLFERFKSYEFTKIDSQDQYEIIKEIFTRFQNCSDIDSHILEEVEEELTAIEERLIKKESIDEVPDEIEDEDVKKSEKIKEKETEEARKKKELEAKKQVEAEKAKRKELDEPQKEEEARKKKELEEAQKKLEASKQKKIEKRQKQKEVKEAKKKLEAEKIQKNRIEAEEAKKKKEAEEAQKKRELEESQKKELEQAKKKREVEKSQNKDTETEVQASESEDDLISDGENPHSDEDIFDADQDIEVLKDKEKRSKNLTKTEPVIVYKDAKINLSKDLKKDEKEDELKTEEKVPSQPNILDSLDQEDFSSYTSDEEELSSETSDDEQPETTGKRLKKVLDRLSNHGIEEEDQPVEELEEILVPLSKEVEEIVSQEFPLEAPKSINDLFLGTDQSQAAQLLYLKNLKDMRHFENRLCMEKSKAEDDRFEDYMHEFDGAFQRAWTEAYNQCDDLHKEFAKALPQAVQLNEDEEVICTTEQLQWVSKTIANRFPAIYHLAFDAPSLDIYQSHQMASLARAIFVGRDAHEKAAQIKSSCCFSINETIDKETPSIECESEFDPLLQSGSFIYTCFVNSSGKIAKEADKLKKQLKGLARSYVKNWLERPGLTLEFGKFSFASGQVDEDISANDWVTQVRDTYTQALKSMDAEQLQKEIQKAYACPLVKLAAKTFMDELDEEEWVTSTFPEGLMHALFDNEIDKFRGNFDIQQGIQRIIKDTSFEDHQDIVDLAQKAEVAEDIVESLIRIRIFYIMCCLGQNSIQSVALDLDQLAKTMYDPSTCETVNEPALICESSKERIIHFDEAFDELTITIKNQFKNPDEIHTVAQAQSVISVSSISQPKESVETSIIELKDLKFSLYSSLEQMRYLTAQMSPEMLVGNIQKLAKELKELKIYKKAEQFKTAKEENNQNNSFVNRARRWSLWSTPFDSKSYQDFDQDGESLDEAIEKAKELVTYLNTQSMLQYNEQLSEEENNDIQSALQKIREHFKAVSNMLLEVYPIGSESDDKWNIIRKKSKILNELAYAKPVSVAPFSDSEDDLNSGSSSPSPNSSEDENDHLNKSVIGKTAGMAQKTFLGHIYDYTFGLALNETNKVKYLAWKVERYEDLIRGIQNKILDYIRSQEELGDLKKLINEANKTTAPEWLHQLQPILKFCSKDLRDDKDRMNPDYLEEVRKTYTDEMLEKLRNAAKWAKDHPSMPGVEHVNAICYQLYATMDINERCREIFKTFIKLGEETLGVKAHRLPTAPLYAMIDGLREANEKIYAVPFEAKAPYLKQVGNSARGWLNGVYGMTTFDPNKQSNPMHVFFNKIISVTGIDSYHVKDIAMGSPTIEDGSGKVEIAPEFEGMLRHYQKEGFVHLYINNQDFTATNWAGGNEANRCQALHDLAENNFKDTLYVITLNQNTAFYKQRYEINKRLISIKNGIEYVPDMNAKNVKDALIVDLLTGKSKHYLPAHLASNSILHNWMTTRIDKIHKSDFNNCDEFENEESREKFIQRFHNDLRVYVEQSLEAFPPTQGEKFGYSAYYSGAKEFKDELIAQLFDGKPHETGNYIPVDLVKKFDLRQWSTTAIDQIHKELFGDRKDLTAEDRRIFIRIIYQNLSRKILIETKANSYNASCKDRIDRGAATDAEDFAYLAILADCMNKPHVIEFFQMLVFARAIIVRKRTIIEERLERLVETVKFMLDHQNQLQKLHATLFPNINITIDQFGLEDEEVVDELEDELGHEEVLNKVEEDLY